MNFTPTEDRRMLSDTLRRYLADKYPFEIRSKLAYDAPFHSPEKYVELAELGVIGAFLSEEQGGFGGSGFDIATVFEELGRALCPEPMLGTLMAVRVLTGLGQDALVEEIVAGGKRPAFAVFEPEAGERLQNIRASFANGRLDGQKAVVYGAPGADLIVVAARGDAGIGLYATEAAEIAEYAMVDGSGAGTVLLDGAEATCLAEDCEGVIEAALDAGRLALCAEAVGAMDVQQTTTIDYMKQRSQFGRPIATFQALQHRVGRHGDRDRAGPLDHDSGRFASGRRGPRALHGDGQELGRTHGGDDLRGIGAAPWRDRHDLGVPPAPTTPSG